MVGTTGKEADTEMQKMEGEAAGEAKGEYSIKGLLAMTPEAQLETFGLNDQLESMREYLQEMDKLTGKAREEAERQISQMFTPDVSASRMRWALEDAKRADKKGGKAGMEDCSCTSVMD